MRPALCIVMSVLVLEDTAISRQIKRHGRPACLRDRVTTLARRWERHGPWRTVVAAASVGLLVGIFLGRK